MVPAWYVMLCVMVKAKRKTEHITLLVDKQVLRAVAIRCKELGVTRSQYLRDLAVKDLEAKDE